MREGYFPLYRKFLSHWLWTEEREFSRAEAWIDMLGLCAYAPGKHVVQGELFLLQTGDFVASERFLCERWRWSRTKLRCFFELLAADHMITRKKDQGITVVNIVNYARYALHHFEKRPEKNQGETSERPQRDQIEEGKEVQKKKEYPRAVEDVIRLGSTLQPAASETFCRWWHEQMVACGWLDAKQRPIINWKAAFTASWRAAHHREEQARGNGEGPRAHARGYSDPRPHVRGYTDHPRGSKPTEFIRARI